MAAKTVEVEIDQETSVITAEAFGYQGIGCEAIIGAISALGEVKVSKKKPEGKLKTLNLSHK